MKANESNSEDYFSDSSTDFFDAMDNDVNSMVTKESQPEPTNETTHNNSHNTDNSGSQRRMADLWTMLEDI